jgi:hypothetical protein
LRPNVERNHGEQYTTIALFDEDFCFVFFLANSESVLGVSQPRHATEIVLNEVFRSTKIAKLKRIHNKFVGIISKAKANVVSCVLSLVSKTVFGIFQECLVRLKTEK